MSSVVKWIVFEETRLGRAFGEFAQNEFDGDSRAANHGLSHHDRRINGDAFSGHCNSLGPSYRPSLRRTIGGFVYRAAKAAGRGQAKQAHGRKGTIYRAPTRESDSRAAALQSEMFPKGQQSVIEMNTGCGGRLVSRAARN